jgi:hypothetical protein
MGNLTGLNIIIHRIFDSNARRNFYWLKIYEKSNEIENNNDCNEDYQGHKLKLHFWERVRITMKYNQLIIYSFSIVYICIINVFIYKSLPAEYKFACASINSILFDIAISTSLSILCTSMIVFHHICHNLFIRFNAVNIQFNDFCKTKNQTLNRKVVNYQLVKLLLEHNRICYDLFHFNKFWGTYLAIKYFFLPLCA